MQQIYQLEKKVSQHHLFSRNHLTAFLREWECCIRDLTMYEKFNNKWYKIEKTFRSVLLQGKKDNIISCCYTNQLLTVGTMPA